MKAICSLLLFACLLCASSSTEAQGPPQKKTARQTLILQRAPIVFLARPIEGEVYVDKRGRQHYTTLLQVMEVLRGQKLLHAGFVELVDSVSPSVKLSRVDGLTSLLDGNDWGIYFCSPANWAHHADGYKTDNESRVQLFRGMKDALIVRKNTVHGPLISGLYEGFASEADVKKFLSTVPSLAPINKPIEAYRQKKFIDIRPAKAVETPKKGPIKPAGKAKPGHSMGIPFKALPDFPRIMHQLRNKQPLSPADRSYVKKYISHLMPDETRLLTTQRSPRFKIDANRISKKPVNAVRSLLGDTTLTLSIKNLQIVEGLSCGRAYEGELWLKTNQPSIYMDQLYFEMSTTANLKKIATPFGPQLEFAYTPLAGAPDYIFYHFYDEATNKIIVIAYPDFFNPQRVQLSTSTLQPFFRFHYSQSDSNSVSMPSLANARAPRNVNTVNFTPLSTIESINYTNYFLFSNPVDEQTYYPHHFTNQAPDVPAFIKAPLPLAIDTVFSDRANITAGTRATIWIRGSGFGATRISAQDSTMKGEVRFTDADLHTHPFLPGLDDSDYDSSNGTIWSDTLIKIVIPSFTNRPRGGAMIGAGPIRVKASCGNEVQSRDTVKIRYNLHQATLDNKKEPLYLASIDCSKGRVFFLDSSVVLSLPNARPIIKAALRVWSDSLGVPITLSNKIVTGFNKDELDTINVISFSSALTNTNTLMATQRYAVSSTITKAIGNTASIKRAALTGADIIIKPNHNWGFDSTGTTTLTGSDFYAAMLHEVGHSLGLNHSSVASDIMYFTIDGARYNLASGRRDGLAGARHEVRRGKLITNWGFANIVTFGNQIPRCSTQNRQAQSIFVTKADLETNKILMPSIYPNPFSGESYLVLPATMLGQVDCTILDATGRIMSQSLVNNTAPIKLGKDLPTGLYMVRITAPFKTFSMRMVKVQ